MLRNALSSIRGFFARMVAWIVFWVVTVSFDASVARDRRRRLLALRRQERRLDSARLAENRFFGFFPRRGDAFGMGRSFARSFVYWDWADEPWSEGERQRRSAECVRGWVSFGLLSCLAAFCLFLFGNPIPRAAASFEYAFQSWRYVILGKWMNIKGVPFPSASNSGTAEYEAASSGIRWFTYLFGVASGAMCNGDYAREWVLSLTSGLLKVLKWVIWVPLVMVLSSAIRQFLSEPVKGERPGPDSALAWWDSFFIPRVVKPSKAWVSAFASWFRNEHPWLKWVARIEILSLCVAGWTIMDAVTSYILLLGSFEFGWFVPFVSSLFADVFTIFRTIGIPGGIVVWGFLSFRAGRREALDRLRAMQGVNEQTADSLKVATIITGQAGIGKTSMMTSLAIDMESGFREKAFGIMRKYTMAFPHFPWTALEGWVYAQVSRDDRSRLVDRAQIHLALLKIWNAWKDEGFPKVNADGYEAFFGYDMEDGIEWFDGAKSVPLIDAVGAYAESFFLYFTGQKLAFSNYPIAFDSGAFGRFFPIFSPSGSYLAYGARPGPEKDSFSHIAKFDFRRIKKSLNPEDSTSMASMDGGVEAYTEASFERGNKNDYAGMKRNGDVANPTNDGYNESVKLTRHFFTIDGQNMGSVLFDTQRAGAVNADLRVACEDSILILDRSPEQNALPFWWLDEYICEWAENRWYNFYFYQWRPNRCSETLINRIIGLLAKAFIDHRQRMRNAYGYQILTFNRESGGSDDLTGKRTVEAYYLIWKKIYGGVYKTDGYRPIMDQRAIAARTGWLDSEMWHSTEASSKELNIEGSYFLNDLSVTMAAEGLKGAWSRISDLARYGSDTVSEEDSPVEVEVIAQGDDGSVESGEKEDDDGEE